MTIEELFGTLQQSTVASWRKHLRTAKYAKHMALDEFYKEMPEKVDALIEGWMGAHGKKVKGFDNILQSSNMNTLKYLGELKRVCKEGYGLLGDNDELKSLMDDIVNLINSTLYKVKELSESKSLSLVDYINESLVNEGIDNKFIKLLGNMYNDYGDLSPISDCFHWLDELDWEVMKEIKYAEAVNDINDSVDVEYALDYYAPVMLAMAKAGKKDTIKAISKITDKSEMEDFDINESLVYEAAKQIEFIGASDLADGIKFALTFDPNSSEDDYQEWDNNGIDPEWDWKNKSLIKKFCKACESVDNSCRYFSTELGNFPWDDSCAQMELLQDEFDAEDGDKFAIITGDGDSGYFFVIQASNAKGIKAMNELTSLCTCIGGWDWETITFDSSKLDY